MQTLSRGQMDKLRDKYWNEMSKDWFKLEVLQDYMGEGDGPSLRAWLKGDKKMSIELLRTDEDPQFTKNCRHKISQGVKLLRFHVVEEPLTRYMEWEIEHYKHVSIPLRGELIYIVRKPSVAGVALPAGDLMIFDSTRAIANSYDQNGLVIAADFYDERDDLSGLLDLQNNVVKLAEPLAF
jgi:hypothetical protein